MKKLVTLLVILAYGAFILVSIFIDFKPGLAIGQNFYNYFIDMLLILPCAFVLIGLFEVWIKREIIEKHLGHEAGFRGYFWAVILGGATIGPMLVALPIAYTLYHKGARLQVVFVYIGASAVCRIPMTVFESSYLGAPFTLIRYAVSIPLIILTGALLGRYLEKKNYSLKKEED